MKMRMFFVLLGCAIVFGGVFGYKAFVARMTQQALSHRPPPVYTVSATHARTDVWYPRIKAVGSLIAVKGVDLTAEIDGRIVKVAAEDGTAVEAGQLLVKLDAAVLRAELAGALAREQLAQIELERQQRLRAQNATSEASVDRAASNLKQARAQVARVRARLEKKTIEAPFSGRIGIFQVDPGQYITAGTEIVTLQTLNPILVDFSVPQAALARIEPGMTVTATLDAYPEMTFKGKLTAISPKVDQATRSVDVRARIDNPKGRLKPGMFVQVLVHLPKEKHVVTLPQTAITYNPYGNSVFLIHEKDTDKGESYLVVERKFVKTGTTRGDQVQILAGLEPGQRVVTSGQLKLSNGSRVRINNSITPQIKVTPELGTH